MSHSAESPQRSVREWFALGKEALEKGFPRDAIAAFETALSQGYPDSSLGGEIQIWLATALESAGDHEGARDRCRQLRTHPDVTIRRQSADILYIWEAPVLQTPEDWVVKIPDLSQVEDNALPSAQAAGMNRPKKKPVKTLPEEEYDESEINRQDNNFLWIAIGFMVAGIGFLVFQANGVS